MKLKLNLEELRDLQKVCVPKSSIYINVEISESASEYCKKAIEGQYKFQKGLSRQPVKIEDDTLYKKLCGIKDKGKK